jgi:hypothetical protein
MLATDMRPGQAYVLAQHIEQELARLGADAVRRAVHLQRVRDRAVLHGRPLPADEFAATVRHGDALV